MFRKNSFKILSLDGGGVRGAFTASVLNELENTLGQPIVDYFDLIAGTSTGSVIAALLATGHNTQFIQDFYKNDVPNIFANYPDTEKSVFHKTLYNLSEPILRKNARISPENLTHSKYHDKELKKLLTDTFGDTRLTEINKARLVITAVNTVHGDPFIFKTPHLKYQSKNYDFTIVDALRASLAAPTYFDPAHIENHGFYCDGGVWANNPSLVAYAEAVNIINQCLDLKSKTDNIYMLSIGTGHAIDDFTPPPKKSGILWWMPRILEFMMESQARSTIFYLNRIMKDKYHRINFNRPHNEWGVIDDPSHVDEMIEIGQKIGKQEFSQVAQKFFNKKAIGFKPILK